jgi:hypothetical protein
MRATLQRPSVSSGRSTDETRQQIKRGDAAEGVFRWRRDLEDGTETWCNQLLETFGIEPTSILPST